VNKKKKKRKEGGRKEDEREEKGTTAAGLFPTFCCDWLQPFPVTCSQVMQNQNAEMCTEEEERMLRRNREKGKVGDYCGKQKKYIRCSGSRITQDG